MVIVTFRVAMLTRISWQSEDEIKGYVLIVTNFSHDSLDIRQNIFLILLEQLFQLQKLFHTKNYPSVILF